MATSIKRKHFMYSGLWDKIWKDNLTMTSYRRSYTLRVWVGRCKYVSFVATLL